VAEDILKALTRPELAGGAVATVAGLALMADDVNDLGKTGLERDPPVPHHYLWGFLLTLVGVGALGVGALALLADLVKSLPVQPSSEEVEELVRRIQAGKIGEAEAQVPSM
jgi:hypothetical protein